MKLLVTACTVVVVLPGLRSVVLLRTAASPPFEQSVCLHPLTTLPTMSFVLRGLSRSSACHAQAETRTLRLSHVCKHDTVNNNHPLVVPA